MMPRPKSNKTTQSQPNEVDRRRQAQPYWIDDKAEWGGFCNVRIDEDQKAAFEEWLASSGVDWWSELVDLVGQGMKFSLTYDEPNQAYVATLTGRGWRAGNLRQSMSARAGDERTCMALLMYKHLVLASGDWGSYQPSGQTFLQFG
jgi:hypothetical protein